MDSNEKTILTIGIDVDGVIADLLAKFVKVAEDMFGVLLTPKDFLYYDIYQLFGVDDVVGNEFYFKSCSTFDGVPTIPGAIDSMKKLEQQGHKLVIVTKRWEKELTLSWLNSLGFGHLPSVFLHFNEPMVKVDVMIDDSPKKLANLCPWITYMPILFNQPNNKYCLDLENRFLRVDDWDGVLKAINILEQTINEAVKHEAY